MSSHVVGVYYISGDIENGAFRSHGPGWMKYPEIENEVQPMHDVDDGTLYLTKDEFFKHFETVYLGASDMTSFLLDGMKMSKHSKHLSQSKDYKDTPKQSTHSSTDDSIHSFIVEEIPDEEDWSD